ncbi:M15 family metallopeptidase [Intestinibacter bartlettii]|uniref:M15 family metallopeptidase n=1 Tax=Intestinibacter bartlettii TaxID=261299 RepID=A0ABS6DVJ1_9FIRM|nr:M15 family metallopeptidase [Intestinibacter bartlettii]MBU5335827.1 M15 family metallopeptidase [Intestinibacter bartlettii]MDO5010680.1 M15 family metallopeptidase [Intestinibacter bartlettii]
MDTINDKKIIILFLFIFVISIFTGFEAKQYTSIKSKKNTVYTETSEKVNAQTTTITKNKNGAYNVLGTIIVNKKYGLGQDYTYKNNKKLFDEATDAFNNMQQDALKDGISINIVSRYRSYDVQSWLYKNYKKTYSDVDTFSAKPGFSEHQTGLAFDVNGLDPQTSVKDKFEFTKEYEWLKNNAYKYGFILRYPKGKSYVTGYKFEPWHYRYVGTNISYVLKDGNTTLEEYLSIY